MGNVDSVAHEIGHHIYLLLFGFGCHCSYEYICTRCYIGEKRKVRDVIKENCQIIEHTMHSSLSYMG